MAARGRMLHSKGRATPLNAAIAKTMNPAIHPPPPASRAARLARLTAQTWDVLIIGGGISGAGVLREAARQGWKVLLVEQRDFAWGTSSRSSKLVHGGLRYLKEGQLRTTFHSVRERQRLMKEAPELIESQSFLFADCAGRKPGRWLFELGLQLYDRMAGERTHRYHPLADAQRLAPGLAPANLRGAMVYRDAKTDDARLVWRVLQAAEADGGLAVNYLAARQPLLENDQLRGFTLEDVESGQHYVVKAKCVVNATGVWADRVRHGVGGKPMLRPLRGSHLMIPFWRLPVAQAISLMHPYDGRPVFFYPWEGATLVGTTDLDHRDDLDIEAAITPTEVAYLLAAINEQFPDAQLELRDVAASYAGVRPVIDDGAGQPSSAGRDHIVLDERGLITVTGGKLTTFRLMALDAIAIAARHLGRTVTHADAPVFAPAARLDPRLPATLRHRLAARYGVTANTVLQISAARDYESIPGTDTVWLELAAAARSEQVVHLDDLLLRRTRLGILLPRGGLDHLPRIRQLCTALAWDDATWSAEIARYQTIINAHYSLPDAAVIPDWRSYLQPVSPQERQA